MERLRVLQVPPSHVASRLWESLERAVEKYRPLSHADRRRQLSGSEAILTAPRAEEKAECSGGVSFNGAWVQLSLRRGRNLGFFKHGLGFGVESEADLLGVFGKEHRFLSSSDLHKEPSWPV